MDSLGENGAVDSRQFELVLRVRGPVAGLS